MLRKAKMPVKQSSSAAAHKRTDLSDSGRKRQESAQPDNSGYDFGKIPLFPVQPKLEINIPGDKFEHEADQMAENVMQMPENNLIQRKCSKCEEEEKNKIQRKGETLDSSVTPSFQNHLNHSKTGGQPLPSDTNHFMSRAFGTDFSHVRVHDYETAHQMNQNIHLPLVRIYISTKVNIRRLQQMGKSYWRMN